jgi:hypothetical protein
LCLFHFQNFNSSENVIFVLKVLFKKKKMGNEESSFQERTKGDVNAAKPSWVTAEMLLFLCNNLIANPQAKMDVVKDVFSFNKYHPNLGWYLDQAAPGRSYQDYDDLVAWICAVRSKHINVIKAGFEKQREAKREEKERKKQKKEKLSLFSADSDDSEEESEDEKKGDEEDRKEEDEKRERKKEAVTVAAACENAPPQPSWLTDDMVLFLWRGFRSNSDALFTSEHPNRGWVLEQLAPGRSEQDFKDLAAWICGMREKHAAILERVESTQKVTKKDLVKMLRAAEERAERAEQQLQAALAEKDKAK